MNTEENLQMEYNTAREMMHIPEYGRNIQKMIEYAKTIADREERNRAVNSIIKVMGQVNPYLKNNEDLTHKLWDHMFIIADFDIDVDSPFPKPSREDFETGPERIPYPENEIAYRHYGRVIEQMIKKVAAEEDEKQRIKMGVAVANIMKRSYLNWNRDSVDDRVIKKDLSQLSAGKIQIPADIVLEDTKDLIDPTVRNTANNTNRQRKGRKRKKNNRRRN